jgi:hypothetical protein
LKPFAALLFGTCFDYSKAKDFLPLNRGVSVRRAYRMTRHGRVIIRQPVVIPLIHGNALVQVVSCIVLHRSLYAPSRSYLNRAGVEDTHNSTIITKTSPCPSCLDCARLGRRSYIKVVRCLRSAVSSNRPSLEVSLERVRCADGYRLLTLFTILKRVSRQWSRHCIQPSGCGPESRSSRR